MPIIISGFTSLAQYCLYMAKPKKPSKLPMCPQCHADALIKHGFYPRKACRAKDAELRLNPVLIQRYFCKACHQSCSALPECIPPRRWYLWDVQEDALKATLCGKSYQSIAKVLTPSRGTIARWVKRFKTQWHLYADHFRQYSPKLQRASEFQSFFSELLSVRALASVMLSCHQGKITIP
ncbi:MAG: transposase [Marinomonas sp.]